MNKTANTFSFKGLDIPFYHLKYKGEFYDDLRLKNRFLSDGTRVNEEFAKQTKNQIKELVPFDKATMMIVHYFPDYKTRDLDNNYYKPVIDSIRKSRIIKDDSWQNLSLLTLGDIAEQESIELYVVPHKYTIEFLFQVVPEKFNIDVQLRSK